MTDESMMWSSWRANALFDSGSVSSALEEALAVDAACAMIVLDKTGDES
jgi:hypothetical protein